jgi:hypothetical protein
MRQRVKMHLLKYAYQNILKIVIFRLALMYYAHQVLCISFYLLNFIRFKLSVKFM